MADNQTNGINLNMISFELPKWLVKWYLFVGILSIFLNSFGLYLIIWKGSQMDKYRFYLIFFQLLQFCSLAVDIQMNFLMQPIGLFPITGGYANGILAIYFNFSPHILQTITNFMTALQNNALALCFIRKHQTIAKVDMKYVIPNWFYNLIILSMLALSFSVLFLFYSAGISKEEQLEYISQSFPNLLKKFNELPNFSIYKMSKDMQTASMFISLNSLFSIILVIYSTYHMSKRLKMIRVKLTVTSFEKHKAAIRSLFWQFIVSFLCIIPPIILSIAVVLQYERAQLLAHILNAIFASHSSINVIVMIWTFPTFRKFVLRNKIRNNRTIPSSISGMKTTVSHENR
ncbi:unnamed protein product [Caenorhabditis angaria]|uniref:Uncharacterized protein n=1 Tax=Caenorhabditis angaria TaxID=860376 RepID=A0A9P1I5U2_9PELO|nr:unnamed protein product [Caenorhabditis angaria]